MFRSIFIACMLVVLSACSTFQPTVRYVHVYPASEAPQIASTTATPATPAPSFEALQTLPEPLPEPDPIVSVDPNELHCLSQALYFEARGEGTRGMLAVGFVIHNRVNSPKFKPKTYCGVVRDGRYVNGRIVRNACQFSFYCDGKPERIADTATFELATGLARDILTGEARNPVGPSLYFHERSTSWKYASRFTRIARIGNHIFYA